MMAPAAIVVDAGGDLDEHRLAIYLGLIGLIVIASGLVSGLVERGPFSQVLVFVALGVLVGPAGLDAFDFGIDSAAVEVVGTISLVLVFFTDAVKINLGQLRANWILPAIALGPGAVLTVLLIALSARIAFNLSWTLTYLIAAVLASTDAVLLRDVINDRRVPRAVRHTLSIEAGMNDVIVLPLVLLFATLAAGGTRGTGDWVEFAFDLYVFGPLIGVAVAFAAIRAVGWLRRRHLIRRDYESIYSIGVAFVAFAAAQLAGGSGFVAAFAAGLTIALMDEELCDCFIEYGETTAEMAMLLTFVFLGAALVEAAIDAAGATTLLFAAFVLLVARPVAMLITIRRSRASWGGRLMIAWFGPRGLNTLLLTILAVAAGIPEQDRVFGIVGVVVLCSMVVHGISATPTIAWYTRRVRRTELPEEVAADAGTLLHLDRHPSDPAAVPRMEPAELYRRLHTGEPITVVDIRRGEWLRAAFSEVRYCRATTRASFGFRQ